MQYRIVPSGMDGTYRFDDISVRGCRLCNETSRLRKFLLQCHCCIDRSLNCFAHNIACSTLKIILETRNDKYLYCIIERNGFDLEINILILIK